MSKAMPLQVGIDDLAVGSGATQGFTIVTIPDAFLPAFDRSTATLLKTAKKKEFHAKDYSRKLAPHLEEFLALVQKTGMKSPQCRAVTCLFDRSLKQKIDNEALSALTAVAGELGLTGKTEGSTVLEEAMHLAPPLILLSDHSDWLGPRTTMTVRIAKGNKLRYVGETICNVGGVDWDAPKLIQEVMNRRLGKRFRNNPTLSTSPIKLAHPQDCPIVQAADVFGNYFLSLLRAKHGAKSAPVVEKTEAIKRVFGDSLKIPRSAKEITWTEKDDLIIQADWIAAIQSRWYMTSPPAGKQLSDFPGAAASGKDKHKSEK
jgi:hypothetical protein